MTTQTRSGGSSTFRRAVIAAALVCSIVAVLAGPSSGAPAAGDAPPPVGHVFVIVLENKDYEVTFGADSPAPYLATTLTAKGQLLTQYFGIGHVSLPNYIAMISGQAPNPVTQSDCQIFQDFVPPAPVIDGDGQAIGAGCVLPAGVTSLPDQLEGAGFTWRGYMQDMDTPCRHPSVGSQDDTQSAEVGDQYATRHNPFAYFHSIIDDDASCQQHVVDLAALSSDLATAATTPNFSFITPDLCHDGHDEPCVDGQPGGLVSADALLEELVPKILASPAYKQDGMLLITFDEAEVGDPAAAEACCGEVPGPNSPLPGINGPGGGRVGGVVLSPFVAPGSVNDTPYNHYALLRTVEDLFDLPHLGFAAAAGLRPFGGDVFNAASASDDGGTDGSGSGSPSTAGNDGPQTLAASGGGPSTGAVAVGLLCGLVGCMVLRRSIRRLN